MTKEEIRALFEDFYESWYSSLVRYVARLTGSTDLAKDVVQDSFLTLCNELVQGRHIENPKGWTFRVVRRQIGRQMSPGRRFTVSLDAADEALWVAPQEEEDGLSRLMAHLSPREQEVVLLRLEGFKYREIAEQLSIGASTVKELLARAMRKMRETGAGAFRCPSVEHANESF